MIFSNKKYRTFLLALPLVLLGLQSCQKVIDIDLEEADKRFVVEGGVYEGSSQVKVRVSKTTSFFNTAGPEGINTAAVTLTMPDGTEVPMISAGNGYYIADGLNITTESEYGLEVLVEGQTFTATSYMEAPVSLDSLEYEFNEAQFGMEEGYSVFLHFDDQLGADFYRIVTSVNGELLNEPEDILVVDDNLNDGNHIRIPVFTHQYDAGDTVEAELQVLNPDLYEFYQTFAAVASEDAGSPFSAAPANPESNIKGGALGVFGAYTSSKRTIILPQ